MIADPLGGVAQRRAARQSVGLRPVTARGIPPVPPIPPMPRLPQLSVMVPTEEALAASTPLRHSTVTEEPVSPVTDICVSPSWSDFGGKKRKKEKKARDKIRRELEKERKEQEKRLKKAREQETRSAKAAGQRPHSSQSNERKIYYVPPISQDRSYNRQPRRIPPGNIKSPVTSGILSTGTSEHSPNQHPRPSKPAYNSDFYAPEIRDKIIVNDPPLDSEDEYERDLITHAYHLTLSQSAKSLAAARPKITNEQSLNPDLDSQTAFPISPVSPEGAESTEPRVAKDTLRHRSPSPLPIQVDNCESRIEDVSMSIPHIPQELYSTDDETISESGNSVIDGSDNFASAEESYDDYNDRVGTSDSDDYAQSGSQATSRMAAAAEIELLRRASEKLHEFRSEQSRPSSRTRLDPGPGHHHLSYAQRQRLGSLSQSSITPGQRSDSPSDYGERNSVLDIDSASARSFLLDESPISGPTEEQRESSFKLDEAEECTGIESPSGSIGVEPQSYIGRRIERFSKNYSLESVKLESTKAEDGFWEDLWPVFSKSESTPNLTTNEKSEGDVKPRLSSVDSGKPSLESAATTRDLPMASKAEYSNEEGAFENHPKNSLRRSRGSKTLSIEVPKGPPPRRFEQKSTDLQVYEPLTAKRVELDERLLDTTGFQSAPTHQLSFETSPRISVETISPVVSDHGKKVESTGPPSPPSPLSPPLQVSSQQKQQDPAHEAPLSTEAQESLNRIQALSSPKSLRSLSDTTKPSKQEDLPVGVIRKLSVTRTQSSPVLRKDNIPSDLSFLPELRHQALVKPEHSKVSSIDTSRGSSSTSGSSLLSGYSRMSSIDFPSPTAPSIRSTSDDGFPSPLGASSTNLLRDGGMKAGPRPQRAIFRPAITGRRQTMAPQGSSQAGMIIAQQQKPMAKMFVICCKCKFWHDLPSKIYEAMALPRKILEDEVEGVTKGKVDTVVKCPWCEHGMSSQCCAGWTTVVYLHERHH